MVRIKEHFLSPYCPLQSGICSRISPPALAVDVCLMYIDTYTHCECMRACSVVSDSLWPHGLIAYQALLSREFSRQEYGAGCHFLLQGISPTQGSNPCLFRLLHWQADSLPLCHLRSPVHSVYPFNVNVYTMLRAQTTAGMGWCWSHPAGQPLPCFQSLHWNVSWFLNHCLELTWCLYPAGLTFPSKMPSWAHLWQLCMFCLLVPPRQVWSPLVSNFLFSSSFFTSHGNLL